MKEKKNNTEPNLILRVYNVPPSYTVSRLQELIEESCSTAQLSQVIPPNQWDDIVDTCWIILCKDRKTHDALLDLKDIWYKDEKNDKYGGSITFVAGEEMDLTYLPFKTDEQMVLNEHLKNVDL